MIQIDKVLIDFFKHFMGANKISFDPPIMNSAQKFKNNLFIPPEIIIVGRESKLINVIMTIQNNKANKQPDQQVLNTMLEMLRSLSSENVNLLKNGEEVRFYGVPLFSDFENTNNVKLLGEILDIDLTEMSATTTTYNVSLKIKAVKC